MTARLVFMGTPESAVPTLRALNANHEVALVVTQPDRPRGRSKKPVAPPVKTEAENLGLPVAQPETHQELASVLTEAAPFDAGVVVAYGRILKPEVLATPAKGMLNLHFSLLPRWRGAAPVARALMAGDEMTGVTIIELDEGLDTGPVLTAQAVDIPPEINAGELTVQLADVGARLLDTALAGYLDGNIEPVDQSDEGVTYADKIERDDRPIDPEARVHEALGQIRGLSPDPAATLEIDGEPHKIIRARAAEGGPNLRRWAKVDGRPLVGLSDGALEIVEIQAPGKKSVSGTDWANGRHESAGDVG